ncbi:UDP-glycosyltransferase 82A1 [Typha angustifolia]|uniref:UDP-glycosyltransferase 82A1 n=1 Tax=Typha angustifolia TaxID=59011 RepID=UPI003C300556
MRATGVQGKIILVPFPAQGHVTPMLHLALAFEARGFAATVACPDFIHRRIADRADARVALASIPSGLGDGDSPKDFATIVGAMEAHMPAHLEDLIRGVGPEPAACVVVDLLASWAIPVAARCGVPVAGFWPAMFATYRIISAIPELMRKGFISECGMPLHPQLPCRQQLIVEELQLPTQAKLSTKDLPWLVGNSASQRSRFAFWLWTLERVRTLNWILINSFPGETPGGGDFVEHLGHGTRILEVGPLLANNSNKHVDEVNQQSNPSMWDADLSCIEWMDKQPPQSVIYVSFGSWVGPIGPAEIEELARGLAATGRPFLWVLKDEHAWRGGLPTGYVDTVAGRGKVVEWAPQESVLRHRAVGCYLTHCGWNSTLEAILHGQRMLCYPISGDQFVNCAYIVEVWGIGMRLGSTNRSVVEECIERVMGGQEGEEMKQRVVGLREEVMEGRTSCRAKSNLQIFIEAIKKGS